MGTSQMLRNNENDTDAKMSNMEEEVCNLKNDFRIKLHLSNLDLEKESEDKDDGV